MGSKQPDPARAAQINSDASREAARLSADAARYAADKQDAAYQAAMALQESMFNRSFDLQNNMYRENMDRQQMWYDTQRADTQGQREMGQHAMEQLQNEMNGGFLSQRFNDAHFEKDRGYQFRQEEGEDALNRSLAARGGLLSGAGAKAAMRYNQDFASNEFDKAYTRFSNDQSQRYNMLAGTANLGAAANGAGADAIGMMGQMQQNNAAQGTALATNYGNMGAQLGINNAQTLGGIRTADAANQAGYIMNTANMNSQLMMSGAGGPSKGQRAMAGAASGASMGAMFGPWGAAIGGVAGGLMGMFDW